MHINMALDGVQAQNGVVISVILTGCVCCSYSK